MERTARGHSGDDLSSSFYPVVWVGACVGACVRACVHVREREIFCHCHGCTQEFYVTFLLFVVIVSILCDSLCLVSLTLPPCLPLCRFHGFYFQHDYDYYQI